MTILDKPAQLEGIRIFTIIQALDLEVRTGMKLTRNVPTVKALREQYGIKARTKVEALEAMKLVAEAHALVTGA